MKLSFLIAGLLTGAAIAIVIWPKNQASTGEHARIETNSRRTLEPRLSNAELLENCRYNESTLQSYQALNSLSRISTPDIPDLLIDLIQEGPKDQLRSEISSLLIHWAGTDPEAALAWSWKHLNASRRWEMAAAEILETWIASGDHSVLDFLQKTKVLKQPLKLEDAQKDQALSLHYEQLQNIREWLYFYDARMAKAAFERGYQPPYSFPMPVMFVDRLGTPKAVTEALALWKDVAEGSKIREFITTRGHELKMVLPDEITEEKSVFDPRTEKLFDEAREIAQYWNEAKTNLASSLAKASALPPRKRTKAYLAIYDAWATAHRGKTPNYQSLPADARDLWRDLEELGPINSNYYSSMAE